MKKYFILLLIAINLGLGVQGFSAMTKSEKEKLESQINKAYEKKDTKTEKSLILKYLNEFPDDAGYLNMLGTLYDDEENYKEAEKWYLKAIDKGSLIAISNLAYNYIELEDYAKAIKYYKEYEKVADNPDNYYWMGFAYSYLEDYKNAKEWYLKAVKTDEGGFSENQLGVIFDDEGNQKEAMKWYLASIKKGDLWAYNNLAVDYIALGDYENAKKWLEKGLELIKKSSDYSDNLELQKSLKENLDYIKKAK